MKKSTIKVLGFGASIIGIVIGLIGSWLGDKERDMVIREEVTKALTTVLQEKES